MWSLGVITYTLLGGYAPFMDRDRNKLFKKIRRAEYEFHDLYWKGISLEAKELISNLLCTNPQKRLSASQVLNDSTWIQQGRDKTLESNDLGVNLEQFREFNAKRKLRHAALSVKRLCQRSMFFSPCFNFKSYRSRFVSII
jgi:calcium/calmodulin-dependent protein kinase I